MKIGVIEYIDCAHSLPGHPRCGTVHGHTYKVELIIEGPVRNGMVMDFAEMKQSMKNVLGLYDHRSWNEFIDYPSVENICELLHQQLKTRLSLNFTLRVWEGEGKWAEL